MDELYALWSGMRENGERRSCWVWVAMDSFSKWFAQEVDAEDTSFLSVPRQAVAGITDHVWTMGEFLLFRVPPRRQEATAA